MLGPVIVVMAIVGCLGLMVPVLLLLRRIGDYLNHLQDVRFIIASLRAELNHARVASDRGWWRTLGVSRDASISQIDEAYRSRVKAHHPDRTGGRGVGLDLAALQRARMDGHLDGRKRVWWESDNGRMN